VRIKQTRARKQTHGLRERAWWVMRRRGVFTLPELLETVADGAQKDAASNLGKYLRALTRAGILTMEPRRQPGCSLTSNGYLRYRLALDLGIKPPVWRVTRNAVYDPNGDKAYPLFKRDFGGNSDDC